MKCDVFFLSNSLPFSCFLQCLISTMVCFDPLKKKKNTDFWKWLCKQTSTCSILQQDSTNHPKRCKQSANSTPLSSLLLSVQVIVSCLMTIVQSFLPLQNTHLEKLAVFCCQQRISLLKSWVLSWCLRIKSSGRYGMPGSYFSKLINSFKEGYFCLPSWIKIYSKHFNW